MKVRITLIEEMLGTACNNPKVYEEHIAKNSGDAKKIEEELAALPATELQKKAVTVFSRENGKPFIWDYQVKGFIKEAFGILTELSSKEIKVGRTKLTKYTFKRLVDNYVFVSPRKILPTRDVEMGPICTRSLRADHQGIEMVSLASSETLPAGTTFECEVGSMAPSLNDLLCEAMDYGKLKGLGCWRNSGKGRFEWEVIDEAATAKK